MVFTPTPEETELTTRILAAHSSIDGELSPDPDTQKLPTTAAVSLLKTSGLSQVVLRDIWTICDGGAKGYLTRREVEMALRLMGWVQVGEEVGRGLLERQGTLPVLDGITDVDLPPRPRARARTNSRRFVLQNGSTEEGERGSGHEREQTLPPLPSTSLQRSPSTSVDPPPPPLPPLPPPPPAHYYTDTASSSASSSYYAPNQSQNPSLFPGVDPEAIKRYCAVFYATVGAGGSNRQVEEGYLGWDEAYRIFMSSGLPYETLASLGDLFITSPDPSTSSPSSSLPSPTHQISLPHFALAMYLIEALKSCRIPYIPSLQAISTNVNVGGFYGGFDGSLGMGYAIPAWVLEEIWESVRAVQRGMAMSQTMVGVGIGNGIGIGNENDGASIGMGGDVGGEGDVVTSPVDVFSDPVDENEESYSQERLPEGPICRSQTQRYPQSEGEVDLVPVPTLIEEEGEQEEESDSTHSGPEWVVQPYERLEYDRQFLKLDVERKGWIDGEVFARFMVGFQENPSSGGTGVTSGELALIWDLSDLESDEKIESDEFSIAMHLVKRRMAGDAIPKRLPRSLLPGWFLEKMDAKETESQAEAEKESPTSPVLNSKGSPMATPPPIQKSPKAKPTPPPVPMRSPTVSNKPRPPPPPKPDSLSAQRSVAGPSSLSPNPNQSQRQSQSHSPSPAHSPLLPHTHTQVHTQTHPPLPSSHGRSTSQSAGDSRRRSVSTVGLGILHSTGAGAGSPVLGHSHTHSQMAMGTPTRQAAPGHHRKSIAVFPPSSVGTGLPPPRPPRPGAFSVSVGEVSSPFDAHPSTPVHAPLPVPSPAPAPTPTPDPALGELKKETAQLTNQVQSLLAQLASQTQLSQTVEKLESAKKKLEGDLREMEKTVREVFAESERVRKRREESEEAVDRLTVQLAEREAVMDGMERRRVGLEKELGEVRTEMRALQGVNAKLKVELEGSKEALVKSGQELEEVKRRLVDMGEAMNASSPSSGNGGSGGGDAGREREVRELRMLGKDLTRENERLKAQEREMQKSMEQLLLASRSHARQDALERENRLLKLQVNELEMIATQLQSSASQAEGDRAAKDLEVLTKENERLREKVKEKHRALGDVRREGEERRVRLEELERENARLKVEVHHARESGGREEDSSVPPPAYDDTFVIPT